MTLAIRPSLSRWIAAEIKILMPGIAARPAAGRWFERPNFFGNRQVRIGEGLFRCRLDGAKSRRFGAAAAVRPGGKDGDGSLDLSNCYHFEGQQVDHNGGAARDAATATQPPSDASWVDGEPPSDAALCDAERAEHLVELDRGSRQVARFHVNGHNVMRST